MKKILNIILRVSITVGLLIFLFKRTDVGALLNIVKESDLWLLTISFFLFCFLNLLCLLRWHLLIRGLSIEVSLGRLLISFLASHFFNLIFPAMIGGDVVRTIDIASHTNRHSSSILATVFLDRLSGFFGLMTVLIVALLLGFRLLNDWAILMAVLLLLCLVSLLTAAMFSGRFFDKILTFIPFERLKTYLNKIHQASSSYRHKTDVLKKVWLLSVFVQAGLPLMYYLLSRAFYVHLNPVYFMIFVPIILVCSVIPISIGGLGVRDTASVILFAKVGLAAEKAFALSLANYGFMFIIGLVGGLTYVLAVRCRRL